VGGGVRSIRTWAWVGIVAQIVFVVSWLLAGLWQGPRYNALAHTISDMYAVTAPHVWFLLIFITLGGLGTVLFALLGVRRVLQPAGWPATLGSALLALSILGLGDLLTPLEQEGCRVADPGCTQAEQLGNLGGQLDAILSTVGLVLLIAAGFFLAAAMRRLPTWSRLAWPTRIVTTYLIMLILATGLGGQHLGGLFERLLAFTAATAVAFLGVAVLSLHPRSVASA
jgi:hypothetical protein